MYFGRFKVGIFVLSASLLTQSSFAGLLGEKGVCTFFEPSVVPSYFPASHGSLKVRFRDRPYDACTFTWKSKKSSIREIAGQKIEIPGEGRLTLTRVSVKSPVADWQRAISSYGTEKLKEIPGVGGQAVWSDRRHQLSFMTVDRVYLFHVAIEDSDNPLLMEDTAGKIALRLIGGSASR